MPDSGTVVTIGKFDGIHTGHRLLIDNACMHAGQRGLASAVISFEPHPMRVLHDEAYRVLYTFPEKKRILSGLGIDYWYAYPFDAAFAQMSPYDFCKWLKEAMHCRLLITGETFRFGRNRQGSTATLAATGGDMGMDVITLPSRVIQDAPVSSSYIRSLLENGDAGKAADALGRPFSITGEVRAGRRLGRRLGFPTANIYPAEDKFLPKLGVYATAVHFRGAVYNAVTNIGINPTVKPEDETLAQKNPFEQNTSCKVESYILDFDEDAYGEEIIVELRKFIRPEQKFAHLDELKQRIALDVQESRQ